VEGGCFECAQALVEVVGVAGGEVFDAGDAEVGEILKGGGADGAEVAELAFGGRGFGQSLLASLPVGGDPEAGRGPLPRSLNSFP